MGFNIQTNSGTPLNSHNVAGQSVANLNVEQYFLDSYFVNAPSAIAVGSSSLQSVAIGTAGQTSVVRLCSTANCHYLVGVSPTAASGSTYLQAGAIERIRVQGGQKLAVIQDASSTGFLSISVINTTDQ